MARYYIPFKCGGVSLRVQGPVWLRPLPVSTPLFRVRFAPIHAVGTGYLQQPWPARFEPQLTPPLILSQLSSHLRPCLTETPARRSPRVFFSPLHSSFFSTRAIVSNRRSLNTTPTLRGLHRAHYRRITCYLSSCCRFSYPDFWSATHGATLHDSAERLSWKIPCLKAHLLSATSLFTVQAARLTNSTNR